MVRYIGSKRYVAVAVLLGVASWGVGRPLLAADDWLGTCKKDRANCEIFIGVSEARVFSKPSLTAMVVTTLHRHGSYLANPRDLLDARSWFEVVYPTEHHNVATNTWSYVDTVGWVRREDIVIAKRMRRVVACWPIKSITIENGDYRGSVTFASDGSGIYSDTSGTDEKVHVYMLGGLIDVRIVSKPNGGHFWIDDYDVKDRKLANLKISGTYPVSPGPIAEQVLIDSERKTKCAEPQVK